MRHGDRTLAVLLVVGVLAAGCGKAKPEPGTPKTAPTPAASYGRGEIRTVPDACRVVPSSLIRRIVSSGKPLSHERATDDNGAAGDRCAWLLDTATNGHRRVSVAVFRYAPQGGQTATARARQVFDTTNGPSEVPLRGLGARARIRQDKGASAIVEAVRGNMWLEVQVGITNARGEDRRGPERTYGKKIVRAVVAKLF